MLAPDDNHSSSRQATHQPAKVAPKKLTSKRRGDTTRVGVWLEPETLHMLQTLQRFFLHATGRQVSYSLVVRRSLTLLASHASALLRGKDKAGMDAEAQAIRRSR